MSDETPPKCCATCGSQAIRAIIFKYTSEEVTIDRECVTCRTTWTEVFRFDRVTDYTPGA